MGNRTTYTTLFGLQSEYTLQELSEAYRTLAMLYHPDISTDPDALKKMQIINEAYDILKRYAVTSLESSAENEGVEKNDVYSIYKKAFGILQHAFYLYYTNGTGFTYNKPHLKKKLLEAKELFAKVVKEYPYNEWVDDAIDKINSINKWL